jgi:hypothetical protein
MAHRNCPSYCHRCPDLSGEIMPGCMGTAAMAHGPHDMSYCTCKEQRKLDAEYNELRKQVEAIQSRLEKAGI